MAYKRSINTLYILYKRLRLKPIRRAITKIRSTPRTPPRIVRIIVTRIYKHRITEDINDNILQRIYTLYSQLALKHIPD